MNNRQKKYRRELLLERVAEGLSTSVLTERLVIH